MLKLSKETLTELSPDQMATVVGAYAIGVTSHTIVIYRPDSCVIASCITND